MRVQAWIRAGQPPRAARRRRRFCWRRDRWVSALPARSRPCRTLHLYSLGSATSPSAPPARAATFGQALGVQPPETTLTGLIFGAGHLDEALVEGQIVADRVLQNKLCYGRKFGCKPPVARSKAAVLMVSSAPGGTPQGIPS